MFYNRDKALKYAKAWAFKRNPEYFNFDAYGGDCTNFVSQCLYAGCQIMNFTKDFGWYYISLSDRAAAWSGVEYLYNFLTSNMGPGPYAKELPLDYAHPGDIIQLNFDGKIYSHSLLVVSVNTYDGGDIKVATHTRDTYGRNLKNYIYRSRRLLHIEGFNAL